GDGQPHIFAAGFDDHAVEHEIPHQEGPYHPQPGGQTRAIEAHRRLAYARRPTMMIAMAATTQVTAGGVPLGDVRASTTATVARMMSAANVTRKAARERGRSLDGGLTTGSVVAAPHL